MGLRSDTKMLGKRTPLFLLPILMLLAACGGPSAQEAPAAADKPHVLIFSHSTGWRHKSIEPGVAAMKAMLEAKGYRVSASEDPEIFSTEGLADIDALMLINTTSNSREPGGEWWVGDRRMAFQAFVQNGGGVVGIHGASDSHYNWTWYGKLIGGYFESHPPGTPRGELSVINASQTSTESLPTSFSRVDEWYYIKDYNPAVTLLVTLDPASIGEADANPNPISWQHEFDGGRVFYTSMGHTAETYTEDVFQQHVLGGVKWVTGAE